MHLARIFAFLTALILMPIGIFAGSAPANAAAAITFSETAIVEPGQNNSNDLVISLSGLSPIQSVRIDFVGVTINGAAGYYSEAFNSGTSSFANCPNAVIGIKSTISVVGQCLPWDNPPDFFVWRAGSAQTLTTVDVGGNFALKFPAGRLRFSSTAGTAYSAKIKILNGDSSTTEFNQTLTVALTPQAPLSITSTSGTFGAPLALTTSGGTGDGAMSYSVTNGTATGCSVSGGALTTTSAGTCTITATKAADSTYSAVSSSPTTVTFAKASRTLSFGETTSYTLAYGAKQQVAATPSAGVGDGTITYSKTGNGCTVDSSTGLIRVTSATESCTVSASITAGVNYESATTLTQITVNGTVKSITVTASDATVDFGTPYSTNALATGQLEFTDTIDSGTFTYTGKNGTTYGPSSVKPSAPGQYSVTPTSVTFSPGSATNYNITFAQGTVAISKAARALNFTTTPSNAIAYGNSTTLVATATLDPNDGTITYTLTGDSDACSVDSQSGEVTVTKASGACKVLATISAGTNYLGATTATPATVTVGTRAITVAGASDSVTVGNAVSPRFSITSGSLVGSDDITSVTYSYAGTGSTTYASSTTAPTAVGTYSVTASQAVFSSGQSSNYAITYAPGNFSINAKLTRTLNFQTLTYSLEYGDTQTVVAVPSAGASEGVVTYSAGASNACTVNAATGVITVTAPSGTCTVSASITEGASYAAANSATPVSVTVSARAITITSSSQSIPLGGTVATQFSVTAGSLVGNDEIESVMQTYVGTSPMSYAASTTPPTASGVYSVTPSVAVFSTGVAANYTITYVAGTLSISAPSTPSIDLAMSATVGMLVAGSSVQYSASGLQNDAPYSVVVRSTPKVLSSGTAIGGSVNNSATIPSGLGAGWHSLTFTSMAANGSIVKQVIYFEVSENGRLLAKTSVMPAELALTGGPDVTSVGIAAAMALLSGLVFTLFRRRRHG